MTSGGYPANTLERHPLLEKYSFDLLHRNDVVEARPQSLHFGGFQIHKEHAQTLRITNISAASLRVSIIGPTTQYFRISFDKKGLLAPGMSEEVEVVFTPHEWRYYYDAVKVFCGGQTEHVVVPIHAYPSANDIALPSIVDFGRVPLGTQRTRVIPLSCKIPIQFEFEIAILEDHPDIRVSPLSGVIPPDGVTDVVIEFLPTKHRTARMVMQVNVAQFDFNPVKVTVVGSSLPDLSREEVVRKYQSELAERTTTSKQEKLAAAVSLLEEKRNRSPINVKPPKIEVAVAERTIDGVKVPLSCSSQQATNFVLNQTAGKLPLKDLSAFIREQSAAAQDRRRKVTSSSGKFEANEDPQALELRFEMRYREVEKYDKQKELRSTRATGMDQMTEEDITASIEARLLRQNQQIKERMASDMDRVEPVLSTQRVAVPNYYKPLAAPQWDENANDTFSVRLQVIDRFVRVGSKCLMRVRAQRRAERLREAMRAANVVDRESCRAWVDAENRAASAGTQGSQGTQGTQCERRKHDSKGAAVADDAAEASSGVQIPQDFVLPVQIPVSQAGLAVEERVPVEVPPVGDFEEFEPFALIPRLDYKVFQYENYAIPPASAYMRLHPERQRLHAALEEYLVRGERGDALDGAESPCAMPESCLLPPEHDAVLLLVPDIQCRTFIGIPEFTECDPEFRLNQQVPLLGPLAAEPLLMHDLMASESPWLSSWQQTRRLAEPFQEFDALPGSFAEAGGQLGAGLGCDAGGQRIAYLPVGGFERDLPSDTDDDEQDDFHIPPPGEDAYSLACAGTDVELASDLWQKEATAEDNLQRMRAEANTAARGLLIELNQALEPGSNLYLG